MIVTFLLVAAVILAVLAAFGVSLRGIHLGWVSIALFLIVQLIA